MTTKPDPNEARNLAEALDRERGGSWIFSSRAAHQLRALADENERLTRDRNHWRQAATELSDHNQFMRAGVERHLERIKSKATPGLTGFAYAQRAATDRRDVVMHFCTPEDAEVFEASLAAPAQQAPSLTVGDVPENRCGDMAAQAEPVALVPLETLQSWRAMVNTLATLTLKRERTNVAIALKRLIQDEIEAADSNPPAQPITKEQP